LWKKVVLDKNKDALNEMIEYCKNDVELLEKVYNEMSNYIPSKTHQGVLMGGEKHSCQGCGSENLKFSKKRISAMGIPRIQMQCNDCGKYTTIALTTYEKNYANLSL